MEKKTSVAYILFFFCLIGLAGFHKFYVGKIGLGIFYLITFGFFGIGLLIDLFYIPTEVRIRNEKQLEHYKKIARIIKEENRNG